MKPVFTVSVLTLAFTLTACSGGGSSSTPDTSTPNTSSTGATTEPTSTSTPVATDASTTGGSPGSGGANTSGGTSSGGNGVNMGGATDGTAGTGPASGGTSTNGGGGVTAGNTDSGNVAPELPQNISNAPVNDVDIAMDANGNALAVWQQTDGTTEKVYYGRYSAHRWNAPQLLVNTSDNTTAPRVSMSGAGDAIAVWVQPNPYTYGIDSLRVSNPSLWGRHFTLTGGFESPVVVSNRPLQPGRSNLPERPRVTMDDSGAAMAVWYDDHVLNGNYFSPTSGWQVASEYTNLVGCIRKPVMNGRGASVVLYSRDGGGGGEANLVLFDASGWHDSMRMLGASECRAMAGVMDVNGIATVVAYGPEPTVSPRSFKYQYTRYTPGAGWSTPSPIPGGRYAVGASMVLDANGDPVLVYEAPSSTSFAEPSHIYATRFIQNNWQIPRDIGIGTSPHIVTSNGRVHAAWVDGSAIVYTHLTNDTWQASQKIERGTEIKNLHLVSGTNAAPLVAWSEASGMWSEQLPSR